MVLGCLLFANKDFFFLDIRNSKINIPKDQLVAAAQPERSSFCFCNAEERGLQNKKARAEDGNSCPNKKIIKPVLKY